MNALVPHARRGVLLVNVGTPEAPTTKAVRAYLREFLGDPKVIDLPAPARWLLLNLIILPFRPSRSAHAYQQVWTAEGSPLLSYSKVQRAGLAQALPELEVVLGMRYGKPSLAEAAAHFRAQGITDVILVPLFPQDAAATTGSCIEGWEAVFPGSASVPAFYNHPGFIAAAAERVKHTVAEANADFVLFSYHGLPVRQVERVCKNDGCAKAGGECPVISEANTNCYRAQCYATSRALAQAAGVSDRSTSSFQSRIKGETWISPFTEEVLGQLAQRGVKRLAVACPSFVADCLETLEEIGQRGAETFKKAGGESLTLVPAVNDSPLFIDALADLIRQRVLAAAA